MTEKKATHTKKEKATDTSLMKLLIDVVVRSVQSFVDGTIENVRQMTQAFTKRVARQVFLFCFALLGIVLLLVGLAQLLSAVYGVPGIGAMIMGMFILTIVLVVYLFDHNK